MFKIYDERKHFFQWDLNQKIIVEDNTITEVHFCNKTGECALVCEVYKEDGVNVVNVPNILLQDNWTLRVYAVAADHTEYEEHFKVNARSKPADYVYTETECKTFELLEQRMNELENTVSVEGIEHAVKSYLEENPIEAGATAEEAAQIEQNTADIEALQEQSADYAKIEDIPKENLYIAEYGVTTNEEITDARNSGKACFVRDSNAFYPMTSIADTTALFSGMNGNVVTIIRCMNNKWDKVKNSILDYARKQYVDDSISAIDIPEVPTNISAFNNDSGYQTAAEVTEIVNDAIGDIEVSGGSGIDVTGAEVGQTVKIAGVNDSGVPTAWEAVDFPSGWGGGESANGWKVVADLTDFQVDTWIPTAYDPETGYFTVPNHGLTKSTACNFDYTEDATHEEVVAFSKALYAVNSNAYHWTNIYPVDADTVKIMANWTDTPIVGELGIDLAKIRIYRTERSIKVTGLGNPSAIRLSIVNSKLNENFYITNDSIKASRRIHAGKSFYCYNNGFYAGDNYSVREGFLNCNWIWEMFSISDSRLVHRGIARGTTLKNGNPSNKETSFWGESITISEKYDLNELTITNLGVHPDLRIIVEVID